MMTVEEGFRMFHTWLTPNAIETEAAKKHRASIEACIRVNYGLESFFRTGSFGNGTSIAGYSDVDYFASISPAKLHANSKISLMSLTRVLDSRFPRTGVRVNAPAAVVPFGKDPFETTEIVPAYFVREDAYGNPIFGIPNTSIGWRLSSPNAHKSFVDYWDEKLGGKLKALIRFLKAWKYYKNVPIESFYLEMFTTMLMSNENSIIYSIDVENVFERLLAGRLAPITDPMGISGAIKACEKEGERVSSLFRIRLTLNQIKYARNAEISDNNRMAFYWWNQVYMGRFPKYH